MTEKKLEICKLINQPQILYVWELRHRLSQLGRFDLIDVLDNDCEFSHCVKIFLFNKRLGGDQYESKS